MAGTSEIAANYPRKLLGVTRLWIERKDVHHLALSAEKAQKKRTKHRSGCELEATPIDVEHRCVLIPLDINWLEVGRSLGWAPKEGEDVWISRLDNDRKCGHTALPNGSRLSCGRNARGRKAVERQRKRLAGAATQFFPTWERPAASSAC